MPRQTRCIDCNAAHRVTDRPAYHPGPRCDEDWRAHKRKAALAAHGNRIEAYFGIPREFYWEQYLFQGKVCFICRRGKGKTRRLAQDHQHNKPGCDHDPKMGCIKCIRALLCAYCNEVLGRLDEDALRRALEVLTDPPAQRLLKMKAGQ